MKRTFNIFELGLVIALVVIGVPASLARAEDASVTIQKPAITEQNWISHPQIRAIREIVRGIDASLKRKRLKAAERRFESCEDSYFTVRRIAKDKNRAIKWYGDYAEGEDSAWDYQQYYDSMARLRFVLVTVYAANGSREQHRFYFDDTGKLIWNNRKRLKGPGYFAPQDIERLLTEDPGKMFTEAPGCKELKPERKSALLKFVLESAEGE